MIDVLAGRLQTAINDHFQPYAYNLIPNIHKISQISTLWVNAHMISDHRYMVQLKFHHINRADLCESGSALK